MSPIAGAHILLDTPDNDWEATMSACRLDAVDALYISPFIVSQDGTGKFILENEARNGPRVRALVAKAREEARKLNRAVNVIAMQFYGTTCISNLTTDTLRAAYVASIPDVLARYDLDGWDIDYEWNPDDDGNLQPWVPKLLHDIRQSLDKFSAQERRKYYVSITPATTAYLRSDKPVTRWYSSVNQEARTYPVKDSVHFVNVQSYDGGMMNAALNTLDDWINGVGIAPSQLLFGMVSERFLEEKRSVMPSIPEAISGYLNGGRPLAGIYLWRLNGNTPFSNQVQPVLYNYLHKTTLANSLKKEDIEKVWMSETHGT